MRTLITDWLKDEGKEACSKARVWLNSLPEGSTMQDAWDACAQPDWMFWAMNASGACPDDSALRKLSCAFVRRTPLADGRMVWDLLKDERSRSAVEVAERYADSNATLEELARAVRAVRAVASEAYEACAVVYAVRAACEACAVACGAHVAIYVADSAAAHDGSYDVAYAAAHAAQCAIIREFIKCPWGEENKKETK